MNRHTCGDQCCHHTCNLFIRADLCWCDDCAYCETYWVQKGRQNAVMDELLLRVSRQENDGL